MQVRSLGELRSGIRFTFCLILQDLAEEVEAAGAARIAFNPLTPAFAAKALMRAAEADGLPLAPDAARVLAERSAGDLRAAMEALQLAAAGATLPQPPQKNVRESYSVCPVSSRGALGCSIGDPCLCQALRG